MRDLAWRAVINSRRKCMSWIISLRTLLINKYDNTMSMDFGFPKFLPEPGKSVYLQPLTKFLL